MPLKITHPTANQQWGQVTLKDNQRKVHFPFNRYTREVYNHDPVPLISLKCAALTVLTPIITVARSIYWLAQAAIKSLIKFYCYIDGQPCTLSISETARESLRVCDYGAQLTKTAFLGIFKPEENRMAYGLLERELNRQTEPHRNKVYLAICFQPLAKLPLNPSHQDLGKVESKLNHYLYKIDATCEALRTCSIAKLYDLHGPKHPNSAI